eukprot:TRINITY_DN2571_c1_g2_i1.p1 TRINITY_DN2571_c1_g2~~TRINITY_DN2571_c1_g2_i1.p1  ORF type:complete len:383 (-),score=27.10 TRINITY_DN2571_c1_g2_i1:1951-3099(-)
MLFETALIQHMLTTMIVVILAMIGAETTSYAGFTKPPQPKHLSDAPLLHLHIPKTAGTAMAVYIQNNWSKRCAEVRLNPSYFGQPWAGNPGNSLAVSDPNAKCYWVTVYAAPEGQGWPLLWVLTQLHGVKLRYAHGHVSFGACRYLLGGCQYTTVLREPRDRMLSHYFYLRENHPDISEITCQGCDTFKGFLESLLTGQSYMYGSENYYVRMLYGDALNAAASRSLVCRQHLSSCDVIPFMGVNQTHFEQVKENLQKHFPVIGILEDIKTYQALMLYHYDYEPYPMETLRKTQSRLQVEDLDKETLDLLEKFVYWDVKVYEFTKELVQRRVLELGAQFEHYLHNVTTFVDDRYSANSKWNPDKLYKGSQAYHLVGDFQVEPL